MTPAPHPFDFFSRLVWLDGRPLMSTIEPYRRAMFDAALYTFDPDGRPTYDRVLRGVAKKNWKTTDLSLAALYRFLVWDSPAGNDCYIVANDEDQAGDDLSLLKKLIAVNPILSREVDVKSKEIARIDGRGTLKILPAQDAVGAHGKTYLFLGLDEIHGYRNYDLIEALSPDPTRRDVLTWITSYSGIRHAPGIPLYDMLQLGKAGTDPRLHFTWHAGDFTTDQSLQGEDVTPERRANPSMGSWDVPDYLEQQRLRLPTGKYRRLHLNLPGSPEGAAFSAEHIMAAVVTGRRRLPYVAGVQYVGAVDMSGGSNDSATFAIAHRDPDTGKAVLDLVVSQSGGTPFNPRLSVRKFAGHAHEYHLTAIVGDNYAGQTFRYDFLDHGITLDRARAPRALGVQPHTAPAIARQERSAGGQPSASDFYEALEPRLNAGEIELLDEPMVVEQLLTLIWRGGKITHESTGHDDWANAAAIALVLAAPAQPAVVIPHSLLAMAHQPAGVRRILSALRPANTDQPGLFGLTRAHVDRARGRGRSLPELEDEQPQHFRSLTKRYQP